MLETRNWLQHHVGCIVSTYYDEMDFQWRGITSFVRIIILFAFDGGVTCTTVFTNTPPFKSKHYLLCVDLRQSNSGLQKRIFTVKNFNFCGCYDSYNHIFHLHHCIVATVVITSIYKCETCESFIDSYGSALQSAHC